MEVGGSKTILTTDFLDERLPVRPRWTCLTAMESGVLCMDIGLTGKHDD